MLERNATQDFKHSHSLQSNYSSQLPQPHTALTMAADSQHPVKSADHAAAFGVAQNAVNSLMPPARVRSISSQRQLAHREITEAMQRVIRTGHGGRPVPSGRPMAVAELSLHSRDRIPLTAG
jgi:hypothetical protein